MLKNLSLSYKLALAPALALLGLILYVGYTSSQLSTTDSRLTELESRSYPTLEAADKIIFQFSRLPEIFNSAVTAGEVAQLEEARQLTSDITAEQDTLKALTAGQPVLGDQLARWQDAISRYADNAASASRSLIAGDASFEDLRPKLNRMASDLAQAQDLGTEFRANAYAEFQSTLAVTREENQATTRLGIALCVVLIALVSLGAIVTTRSIMSSVHGVIASLKAIANGDGDLTRRVNVDAQDEIGEMIRLFNGFLDKLQDTIRKIVTAASPLGEVSRELYRLTQDASDHARSQQSHTDSIGRDILTMTDTIQDVAQRSQRASEQAESAARQTAGARQSIGSLSSSINDLGDSVMGAIESMSRLEAETQEVGSVLTVIRNIADQTNLLALNAAIEAARAGEQGRGFAVVADEVRNLAQKTATSTNEIQQIIQRLQHSAHEVLDVMTGNGAKSQQSIQRSAEATHLLDTIAAAVDEINQLNAGIARHTQEQIGLSASIEQETQVLQQDAQATAQGAAATARLGEQLIGTEDHLRAATAQFRV
ncbi:methyl-accepting chemotaxis protein [Halopseudomonas xinjiangensis]|uniref:Methyl-accepting chemotaxis protein n=1 Tax=Halopseudomonas xinjiangensis TaxID=487184 RepID=A0A1H1L6Y3_9GAMM|nr:methyl-accepting chemotaxis protein [Halopseudomonas xinjiangensis]SDR70062.1 methyl-accepting chemotaxis protein [Halopseudomonas xinjiangensis]